MFEWLSTTFAESGFMPHGHCFLWKPGLLWTSAGSDVLIGIAYVGIALTLYGLVRKIRIPFSAVILYFGIFIGACGLTHFLDVYTIWVPVYWASAAVKLLTAIASVATCAYLIRLRVPILKVAEAAKLAEEQRLDLEALTRTLEARVEERTLALERSERRLRETIEAAGVGMAEVSLDGHWLTVNRRLCEITGYEPEELRQMTFADVTHPDDLDRDLLQAKALLRGDIPSYSMNKRYLRKDGSQIWVRLTGSLKRGERGEPEYFIASVDDISEQIRTKEELDRSESVFRTVVNAIPQLTWMARPDGHIYWYNDRWREYTGIKTGEVEEGGWQSVHHPEFLQKVIDRWKQSLEAGSPFEMEFPMRGADGRFRWFLTRVLPVRNAAGQVSLWVGTNTLIDEQKRKREDSVALLSFTEKLALSRDPIDITSLACGAVWDHLRPNRVFVYLRALEQNRLELACERGMTAEALDALGRSLDPDGPLPIQKVFQEGAPRFLGSVEKNGAGNEVLRRVTARTGSRAIGLVPIRFGRETLGVLGFGCDRERDFLDSECDFVASVGSYCAQALERARLFDDLEKAVTSRDEFLSIASHELKTPLTTIQLQTQLVKRALSRSEGEPLPPVKLETYLRQMERQVHRLNRLINDMLDISRISLGKLHVIRETSNLSEIARDVVARIAPLAEDSQVSITLDAPDPVVGCWDGFKLEQVLMNLLSNAIRYGGRTPVRLRVWQEGESALFSVSDLGPGVAEKDQARIFDRFERAVSASEVSGFGLGLYISREILRAHGGTITVSSQPGKGAVFTARLPLGLASSKEAG